METQQKRAKEVKVVADSNLESFLVVTGSDAVLEGFATISSVQLVGVEGKEYTWVVSGNV
ncbi:MAG: hypothetical protein LC650_00155 [Actinobacteria bacterium]|nr:hypothetical protein [Actinomycetota bacterium]